MLQTGSWPASVALRRYCLPFLVEQIPREELNVKPSRVKEQKAGLGWKLSSLTLDSRFVSHSPCLDEKVHKLLNIYCD